ncbi:5-bromo-4-chloroindolyl phosphate hydrolysis family protein [Weissella confusa]|uniref:5-bromo-4-chloroindolyl phosphate hydrolysis family protein n=1 Tax=Weissella confusa TaxID=1583 RepID=A0A923NI23_WEICO|nr:5-bromo-4-chloroindolyl phosphate hydrolysis family protein [Weissella confusa]
MEQILVTYQEIANHEMIDESDKAHLKAAREVLRQLADQIQQDYRLITRDDLNSLRDQIDVAKRTMGVFKATFNRTLASVDHVEELLQLTTGLRKIAIETDVMRFARGILKELADDPTQLTEADEFVYTHLPKLLPLMLIGVAWAIPGIGWPVQLLLSGVVLGVRQVVFTPMKQTKQRITTAKQKLTINTDNLSKRDVTAFERIRKMLDLDKIPKKTLRRSKWLTVLMLFLAIGFTPAYLDSISNVLVFAFLVSLVTKPTFVFR